MGTEQWIDRERAIWKVLPLHPQPQPLESFTSYLIRLAEANGLQSIREIVALLGSPRRRQESLYNSPDYPAPSFYAGLAQITGCPEERLLQPTHRHTRDLKMLLSPMPRPLEEAQVKMVGKHCLAFRQRQGLLITEVASLTGQEISVIMDIEQGSNLKKASLHDYLQYADALS